ncbi:unnamed protein product [Adineta steineri]|uniref:Uncharacterized protein n=2 Tax=Adineta steineri TaxID=433720 RepID=A0A814W712_9BILA|nr:unnamed protein product [Adineta steineri]CAF1189043.1 unnamed protein product [Adineta steineri]CAF1201063.1 unnamed protein product [Adineta steineri]CAF3595865.1 unnamed protein product [Adineta steineri]
MVVKHGHQKDDCTLVGTTYSYGEVDWLVIRSKRHFLFLFCFWGALMLAFINSIVGSILEYMHKDNIHGCTKFLRILRSVLYKSSMSIPVMVLFAFNYVTPCLQLRATTFMIFSNMFTYIVLAIQFPILLVVSIDVLYEFYIWKPNATYRLVRGTMKNQPTGMKIFQIILYSLLFAIIIIGIIVSFLIYLELMFLTHVTHHVLVMFNILLSIISIVYT